MVKSLMNKQIQLKNNNNINTNINKNTKMNVIPNMITILLLLSKPNPDLSLKEVLTKFNRKDLLTRIGLNAGKYFSFYSNFFTILDYLF